MNGLNVQLVGIDMQKDFCDPNGALYVKGAEEDTKRLAGMILRLIDKFDDIHFTFDSHQKVDISHPIWWKDSQGNSPDPFTIITAADVRSGKWTTRQPSAYARSLKYLEDLEARNRYPHCIWPYHCLVGSEGHSLMPELSDALLQWQEKRFAMVDFVTKGVNPWTEHFSAIVAEVPDPDDPSTQPNMGFVTTLETADIIGFAGEALSHCVANTGDDLVKYFSDPKYVQKIHLITDASSSVTGFEQLGTDFINRMLAKGMKTTTTKDFLR